MWILSIGFFGSDRPVDYPSMKDLCAGRPLLRGRRARAMRFFPFALNPQRAKGKKRLTGYDTRTNPKKYAKPKLEKIVTISLLKLARIFLSRLLCKAKLVRKTTKKREAARGGENLERG